MHAGFHPPPFSSPPRRRAHPPHNHTCSHPCRHLLPAGQPDGTTLCGGQAAAVRILCEARHSAQTRWQAHRCQRQRVRARKNFGICLGPPTAPTRPSTPLVLLGGCPPVLATCCHRRQRAAPSAPCSPSTPCTPPTHPPHHPFRRQVARLTVLRSAGAANGVHDLRMLSGGEARSMEPQLRADAALLSPSTGILDSHS
eukprot:360252-Chlamydomonas_euryale.AAC.3